MSQINRRDDRTMHRGTFNFIPDDPIYADHFPGRPVVPGSLIVHAFLSLAVKITGKDGCGSAHDFRFKQFLTPGAYAYTMASLNHQGAMSHICHLYLKDRAVVTGRIMT